ncbi:hypothetical protein B0H11DRAFT_2182821 [Mycena galericulata]|nr:hypothetical protein B0H11DRAFT_2182821 [Mycena galericulata]
MLHILSPVLTFFSSPKGLVGFFGGFCVGAQVTVSRVLSGLSVPKNSFRATQTTGHVLLPTKCVPSSGTALFPYVAAIGYAAIVLASLFCILRAKGFSYCLSSHRNHKDPALIQLTPKPRLSRPSIRGGVGPPLPPPDPGSSCGTAKAPRWNSWLWLLLFVLLLLTFSAVMDAYIYCTIHVSTGDPQATADGVASFFAPSATMLEGCLFDGWRRILGLKLHLALHGRQYFKVVLIALSTHFVCILIATILHRLRLCAMVIAQRLEILIYSHIVCIPLIASFSCLSWIFWMEYYFAWWFDSVITIRDINWHMLCLSSRLSSWATSHFVETSTVLGIVVIHSCAVGLYTLFHTVSGFRSTARFLGHSVSNWRELCFFLGWCTFVITVYLTYGLISVPIQQYDLLSADAQEVLWDAISSKESRDTALNILCYLLRRYQDWKSEQIEDFRELTAGFTNTLVVTIKFCLEMWSTMHMSQQFLIAAPAIAFYGYIHVIPAAQRLPRLVRNWRRRYFFISFPPERPG